MIPSDELNLFDKFCKIWPAHTTMEQIANMALIGKVVCSYKIDSLNSFHDQLMRGLWKKSPNGCLYPLDNRHEMFLYVEINGNFEADAQNSFEKLRHFSVAPKVFDEKSKPILSPNQNQAVFSVDQSAIMYDNYEMSTEDDVGVNVMSVSTMNSNKNELDINANAVLPVSGFPDIHQVLDEMSELNSSSKPNHEALIVDECFTLPKNDGTQELHVGVCANLGPQPECECRALDNHLKYIQIGDTQSKNVQEVIDGTPSLGSSQMLVPTTHTMQTEVNKPIVHDHAFASTTTHYNQVDHLVYERRMFAKIGVSDGSDSQDLVIIEANRDRFSPLGPILQSHPFVSLISAPYKAFASSFLVKAKPSFMPKGVFVVNTIEEVALSSIKNRFVRHLHDEISSEIMFSTVQNGWIANVNYKEVQSWGYLYKDLGFWNQHVNVIELPSFQIDVTCPWVVRIITHGSVFLALIVSLTLEDKGDFEEVGNDGVVVSEEMIVTKHIWYCITMVMCSRYVDDGELVDIELVRTKIGIELVSSGVGLGKMQTFHSSMKEAYGCYAMTVDVNIWLYWHYFIELVHETEEVMPRVFDRLCNVGYVDFEIYVFDPGEKMLKPMLVHKHTLEDKGYLEEAGDYNLCCWLISPRCFWL